MTVCCSLQNRGYNPHLYTEEDERVRLGIQTAKIADVAELADAIDLGSVARQGVEVRVLSSALLNAE